jgi:hypothetical protein
MTYEWNVVTKSIADTSVSNAHHRRIQMNWWMEWGCEIIHNSLFAIACPILHPKHISMSSECNVSAKYVAIICGYNIDPKAFGWISGLNKDVKWCATRHLSLVTRDELWIQFARWVRGH